MIILKKHQREMLRKSTMKDLDSTIIKIMLDNPKAFTDRAMKDLYDKLAHSRTIKNYDYKKKNFKTA